LVIRSCNVTMLLEKLAKKAGLRLTTGHAVVEPAAASFPLRSCNPHTTPGNCPSWVGPDPDDELMTVQSKTAKSVRSSKPSLLAALRTAEAHKPTVLGPRMVAEGWTAGTATGTEVSVPGGLPSSVSRLSAVAMGRRLREKEAMLVRGTPVPKKMLSSSGFVH